MDNNTCVNTNQLQQIKVVFNKEPVRTNKRMLKYRRGHYL